MISYQRGALISPYQYVTGGSVALVAPISASPARVGWVACPPCDFPADRFGVTRGFFGD